ncbi:hypothetical protein B0H17DRAFT_1038209 [Mycena rosella]|uniref:Uncharacterized protein n=1 Tax=Mycena rosella TaxID=1033263 RepID=A0AAD7GUC9_MYCRO|nr:hypothetical protein B0H17DRAFT_1038209 [Mycena rosella]
MYRKLGPSVLAYITLTQPSPDLLPLLRSVNPDYLFHSVAPSKVSAQMILDWLKKIRPPSQDLIQYWEDYRFMLDSWSSTPADLDHLMILQACPQLSRYLAESSELFQLRHLLGWSWDETRAAFSSLRAILGSASKNLGLLHFVSASDPLLFQEFCSSSTLRDLAFNCLSIMKKVFSNELPLA